MKPGIQKWKHWTVNVLWYHYKIHILAGAFAAVVLAISIHSAVTRTEPDFILFIASEQPVFDEQGSTLTAFFTERVEDAGHIAYQVANLNEPTQWQLIPVALVNDQTVFLIVGESVARAMGDSGDLFYTAGELGVRDAGPTAEMISLEGVPMMEELLFVFEPMYALIKRPVYDRRGGFYTPDSERRSALAADSLRALLDG
ncbi:MAG: hypothetical protein FWG72_03475 [Oscillospiraceae bacterium]|nr:hypothetical protein [Oscillospiraceae bacterium]